MHEEHADESDKVNRTRVIMLLFAVWMKVHLLAYIFIGIFALGWQADFAIKALFTWMSIAWTIGLVAPIISKSWKAWVIWAVLGTAVYFLTWAIWTGKG